MKDERLTALEQAVSRMCQALEVKGLHLLEPIGPPPKERPEYAEIPYQKYPAHRKAPSPSAFLRAHPHPYWPPASNVPPERVGMLRSDRQIPRAKAHENPEPPGVHRSTILPPAYQVPEEGIWNQYYLSKALQQISRQ